MNYNRLSLFSLYLFFCFALKKKQAILGLATSNSARLFFLNLIIYALVDKLVETNRKQETGLFIIKFMNANFLPRINSISCKNYLKFLLVNLVLYFVYALKPLIQIVSKSVSFFLIFFQSNKR